MHRPFKQEFANITPAPFIKRLMAMVYDTLLIAAMWMVIAAISVALNDGEAISIASSSHMKVALFNSVLFCATFLFFGFFWTRNGQTLGMLAWHLRVQTLAGGRISWGQAMVRFMLAIPSLGLFGVGFIWMLLTNERLALHDRWSGSCVVQLPKAEKAPKKP
ncbi:MAG: RDD family protein [Oceanospirillales bacterium]|uniref:Putative RDD family membrane protein YckC n=1 Tax=Marinobacterium halophilum TaxID=267374 RepID=A0A2P8ESV8_9GAMM|nr:RDD family protein [Marinobacterium halophilum]MBR9829757.1 RDD family protein [Oceanospirillales bacterium]PSL12559.1 putative RDD family membrane protein YckC [Marinobacterium halophilum]